jgi:hypothetical protein
MCYRSADRDCPPPSKGRATGFGVDMNGRAGPPPTGTLTRFCCGVDDGVVVVVDAEVEDDSAGRADKRFCVEFVRRTFFASVACELAKKRGANSGNHAISITVTSRMYCFAVNTYQWEKQI